MDFLTAQDLRQIQQDVKDLTQDTTYASDILYRRIVSSEFNPSTGQNTIVYEDFFFKSCGSDHTLSDIARSGGVLKIGDRVYTFPRDEVPGGLSLKDLFYVKLSYTGVVSIMAGTKDLEGLDTRFISDGISVGNLVRVNGSYGVIASIQTEENAQLLDNWGGDNLVEYEYEVYRQYNMLNIHIDLLGVSGRVSVRRSGQ